MKKLIIAAIALGLAVPALSQDYPGNNPRQDQTAYQRCQREYENYLRDLAAGKNAHLRDECWVILFPNATN